MSIPKSNKIIGRDMSELQTQIIRTKDLIRKDKLLIPEYQRPYKWGIKNINQLIDDIVQHRDKSAYRLGTIVFYEDEEDYLNIVDGQQRTITILLIALAISRNDKRLKAELVKSKIDPPESTWFNELRFTNLISLNNIRNNYREIARRVADFDIDTVNFFYEKCEMVEVVLQDVSEAFQFFDSQNARGKDLAPHDLLKAFHLREMSEVSTELERLHAVENWEEYNSEDLKHVFSNYLFRIRNWSKGVSARSFTKNEVDIFKGVSPKVDEPFPFADLYRIGHFYVEGYNQEYHRRIDRHQMKYPFQIDQVIINGKRFFEMIDHYKGHLNFKEYLLNFSERTKRIIDTLGSDKYLGRNRTGDKYIRTLFDCVVVYYLDKFGIVEVDRAIEKFFIWAYSLRLKLQNVQLASMDNYALEYPQIFKSIREAIHPKEVLSIAIPQYDYNEISVNKDKVEPIIELFKELNYLNE